jgi:hypothetical protein
MEQEADLSTSSSEHLAPVTSSGSVANTSAQKKKSAKSRLAQPFKSLVGRSASLRSKPEEEDAASTAASGTADTLPRAATTKPKKLDKKSKKAMQSGDESKSMKEAVSAGEDPNTEEGKRNRKKKSSIVRRLSNKIRTSKPEQVSILTDLKPPRVAVKLLKARSHLEAAQMHYLFIVCDFKSDVECS